MTGATRPRRAGTAEQAPGGAPEAQEAVFSPRVALGAIPGAVCLTLPYPVSTNRLYRSVRRGQKIIRVKTQEAKAYEARVGSLVLAWVIEHGGMFGPFRMPEPPFRLTFTMYPPTARRIDASNGIKLAEDSIFKAFGMNDKTVIDVRMRVVEIDRMHPRLEAVLEHCELAPAESEVCAIHAWPFGRMAPCMSCGAEPADHDG